jgi:hypothetical protein
MVSLRWFKDKIIEIRKKVEEFKDNHKMASEAISVIISSLPQPFDKFFGVVWNGLEKQNEANSIEKLLVILEKFEHSNEQSFEGITSQLDHLINSAASEEDIRNLGERIQISNTDLSTLISENTERIVYEIQRAQNKTVEGLKKYIEEGDLANVTYQLINVEFEEPGLINKIVSSAINVQLKISKDDIPFIPFDNFDRYKKTHNLIFSARSGYGKSRALLELIGERTNDYKKIYLINPRGTHQSEKTNLKKFVENTITEDDVIVWDNFPNQLITRSPRDAEKILQMVTSSKAKDTLITIHPDYYDLYGNISNNIPILTRVEISYNQDRIIEMLSKYGRSISSYNSIYLDYVKNDERKIGELLWQKEPAPITLLDYYLELYTQREKEIKQNDSIDPIDIAENLPVSKEYYMKQFEFLTRDDTNAI